jgi:hypothetical protein
MPVAQRRAGHVDRGSGLATLRSGFSSDAVLLAGRARHGNVIAGSPNRRPSCLRQRPGGLGREAGGAADESQFLLDRVGLRRGLGSPPLDASW